MKILITSRSFSKVSSEPEELLKSAGIQFKRLSGEISSEVLDENLADCEAIIIGAHPITRENMQKANKLKIICRHGTGVDNTDIQAAKELGIKVTNVPAMNSNAVADTAICLMIDISRKISLGANRLKAGHAEPVMGKDVYKKTLGLMGFGAIAKCVARRAKGFGMNIIMYDPYVDVLPEEFREVRKVTMDELLAGSDIVSLHMPLTADTENIIDSEAIAKMKDGAILINTARGGLVDEEALVQALVSGKLYGAGMDVTKKEPPFGNPLLEMEQVTVLPHMASYSNEAINAVSMVCAENVIAIKENREVRYSIV